MNNIEELFKQICLEEANHLNEFWTTSTKRLSELESEIADEKRKEKNRQLRYNELCAKIDDVLMNDGYNGTAGEVIEYFSRRNLNCYVNNCYFEVQSKLYALYLLLPTKSANLERVQSEYEDIKFKMNKFKHISPDILYNTILKAFQEIIPERSLDFDWIICELFYPTEHQIEFPHSIEVQEQFVDYQLVDWYIRNIDNYLCTPIQGLRTRERERLFK